MVPETPGKFDLRLLYLVSHPIQYQAPLLRLIARDDDIQFLFIQLLGVNLYAPNTDADRSAKVAMISIMVW